MPTKHELHSEREVMSPSAKHRGRHLRSASGSSPRVPDPDRHYDPSMSPPERFKFFDICSATDYGGLLLVTYMYT